MDFMAIYSNKQPEVSTGVKTYDTTVYTHKSCKHVHDKNAQWIYDSVWNIQLHEYPLRQATHRDFGCG